MELATVVMVRSRIPLSIAGGLFAAALIALVVLLVLRADSYLILLAMLALLVLLPVVLATTFACVLARARQAVLQRHAWLLGVLGTLAALAVIHAISVYAVDRALDDMDHRRAYADCRKVWATRGLVDPGLSRVASAGNTPGTLAAAFARGAPGVEVDVYYEPELADFVVSHDFPYEKKVDGGLLMLGSLLAQADPRKHYWLDFKRHGRLTRDQADEAAVRLAAIADETGVARERIWVEGTEPFNLLPFKDAGFSVIFDVHPPRDDHVLTPLVTELHKAVYVLGGFTVMGMNYGTRDAPIYGPVARQRLGDIPVFLYHVPTERDLLADLARVPQVRVLMAGDHSADVFDIDACEVPAAGIR